MRTIKYFLFVFVLFLQTLSFAQLKLCSWNLENFGKSKTDSSIRFIASLLKQYDVIAIVEVVAGNGGSQAVAKLSDALNRSGSKWDYAISEPTSGSPNRVERYAFIWKTNKVKKLGDAWLEKKYADEIEREPFLINFKESEKEFIVAAFHALPKGKQPEKEIKYLQFLPDEYPTKTILFCGDFNCPESNSVFDSLKAKAYHPIFTEQKTSLKKECVADKCLASEYDNLFYPSHSIKFVQSGVLHFYKSFSSLKDARKISDHLPIYFEFFLN